MLPPLLCIYAKVHLRKGASTQRCIYAKVHLRKGASVTGLWSVFHFSLLDIDVLVTLYVRLGVSVNHFTDTPNFILNKEKVMNRRIYWGIASLIIIIIGISVFIFTRTTDQEHEIIYNPLTPAEKAQVDRNIQDAIDKTKDNMPDIADLDIPKVETETTNKNSQQNDSIETVNVENYLEVLYEFEFSVKLPADNEITKFSKDELTVLVHEADKKISSAYAKYESVSTSIREARHSLVNDYEAGIISRQSYSVASKELDRQDKELNETYRLPILKQQQHSSRIMKYVMN